MALSFPPTAPMSAREGERSLRQDPSLSHALRLSWAQRGDAVPAGGSSLAGWRHDLGGEKESWDDESGAARRADGSAA